MWRYELVDTRDDVSLALKSTTMSTEVYKVTSGDSGKKYYVQVLSIEQEMGRVPSTKVYLCNCPEGTFRAPLSVIGLGPVCKHAKNLAVFLKERKSK